MADEREPPMPAHYPFSAVVPAGALGDTSGDSDSGTGGQEW